MRALRFFQHKRAAGGKPEKAMNFQLLNFQRSFLCERPLA
jgi:hypothetical protein